MKHPSAFDTATKILTRVRAGILCALATPGVAWAQSPLSGADTSYTKLALTLAFIVGLIFACGWLVRRMAGGAGFNHRHIKVLSVMPLGTREKLMLVKAADEYLLLGVTPNGITTLHRYDEPVDISDNHMASPFADRMKGLLKGMDSDPLAKHKTSDPSRSNSDKNG